MLSFYELTCRCGTCEDLLDSLKLPGRAQAAARVLKLAPSGAGQTSERREECPDSSTRADIYLFFPG